MANNEQIEKYLTLAKRARSENNSEDAMKYYDMVRTEDPDNKEARFFYPYYRLWEAKKGDWYKVYIDFCNAALNLIRSLTAEDAALVPEIFDAVKTLPASASKVQMDLFKTGANQNQYNAQNKHCQQIGIEFLYKFGDEVDKTFRGTDTAKVAVEIWKQGVSYQQQWPYCGVDKTASDTYVAKIKKYDPSFEPPKKAGCISFAK